MSLSMKFFYSFLFFSALSLSGFGQVNKIFVQGEYVDVPLVEFLSQIEKGNNIKFHYLNEVVKDIRVTGVLQAPWP